MTLKPAQWQKITCLNRQVGNLIMTVKKQGSITQRTSRYINANAWPEKEQLEMLKLRV